MGFVPEVFGPSVRLKPKQFDIFHRGGVTRVIRDVTLATSGLHAGRVDIVRTSLIGLRSPSHRMAKGPAEMGRTRPHYRCVGEGDYEDP